MKASITQDPNKDAVAVEVTAQAIQEISSAVRRLKSGRLNSKALVLLIKHACPAWITKTTVEAVLSGIEDLEKEYLKPKGKI